VAAGKSRCGRGERRSIAKPHFQPLSSHELPLNSEYGIKKLLHIPVTSFSGHALRCTSHKSLEANSAAVFGFDGWQFHWILVVAECEAIRPFALSFHAAFRLFCELSTVCGSSEYCVFKSVCSLPILTTLIFKFTETRNVRANTFTVFQAKVLRIYSFAFVDTRMDVLGF
jgi:hypothetical protein